MELIEPQTITYSYTYENYKQLVLLYAENSKSSGEQTEEHIAATHINAQRIKRIDKQCVINDVLKKRVEEIQNQYTWLVITESWCGDGAQCIPVISKIAELNKDIELKLILRDENTAIMDAFLTNGSRSVPKIICLHHNEVIGTWGPRPKAIQNMVVEYKKNNPNATHDEFVNNLHLWYARDKTNSLQEEFIDVINHWNLK